MKKKFKSPFTLWQRVKSRLWWYFCATDEDKMEMDRFWYGTSITKNGKRIDPRKFYDPLI